MMETVAVPLAVGPQVSVNSVFCCIAPVLMPELLPVGVDETVDGRPATAGLLESEQDAGSAVPVQ